MIKLKLLVPNTQIFQKGRQVVMYFPNDSDAESFMHSITLLESMPMLVVATIRKSGGIHKPESVWEPILEALGLA